MKGARGPWTKLGRILQPDPNIWWMSTCTGSSFAVKRDNSSLIDVYVTGRDNANRSLIGRVELNLTDSPRVVAISSEPVLQLGLLGAFDENGTSYPCLVNRDEKLYLYYTGWVPTVLTPFQNHLGLAIETEGGTFERVSRAPILERTNEDYLSIGSVFVRHCDESWKMWYTSFIGWDGQAGQATHRYLIKYATSDDGVHWKRDNTVCIDLEREGEHSICRPTVYQHDGLYHMWYAYKGLHYSIGYAFSEDGVSWMRSDDQVGLWLSETGWDSESQTYPNVFRHGDFLYMLYCGNDYGKQGLGLARLQL